MVKDFNQHKSNGGIATATIIDEISSFKYKKGNGYRANFKGHPGKTYSKSQPLRECPAWGKKCRNKNHFSTCCRARDRRYSQDRDQYRSTHRES